MPEKHALQKLVEAADEDFKVRSYSGRGMYGKTCLGIDIDRDTSLGDVFASILEAIANDESVVNEDGLIEAAEALRGMRSDNMGLGTIYYFPNVPYSDEVECICCKCKDVTHLPAATIDQTEPFLCEVCDDEFMAWQNAITDTTTLKDFLAATA